MQLVIVHYHLRPGGVRRIIELATPRLTEHAPDVVQSVVLATGEAPDQAWNAAFEKTLAPIPVRFFIEPAFRYFAEQSCSPAQLAQQLADALSRLLRNAPADGSIVWAHNLGIGRNLLLSQALVHACASRQIPLLAHHHDWWFDNRWRYWKEVRHCGFRSLNAIAQTIFPSAANVHHLVINQSDARMLQEHLPGSTTWLPNLTEPAPLPANTHIRRARSWVSNHWTGQEAPFWLLPARVLRRKNVAEALLLTRWLRPGAFLLSTAGTSSTEERDYAQTLQAAAQKHDWPLRLGVLQNAGPGAPSVTELMAASEVILLTSIQEGFGLPYLEAAANRHPLLARAIPNISSDLRQFGFQFPQLYDDILVPPELFDWAAERRRQRKLFRHWRNQLPSTCRPWAVIPSLLASDGAHPVPFSRLTLQAQLNILAHPPEVSFRACAPLNPFLETWRELAQSGQLQPSSWPKAANAWLSGKSYARGFWAAVRALSKTCWQNNDASGLQDNFIRQKLKCENLFPLLWTEQT